MTVDLVRGGQDQPSAFTNPDPATLTRAGSSDPSEAPDPAGSPIARILSALWHFKLLIASLAILGTIGGFVASRMTEPQYAVQSTLWVEAPVRGNSPTPISAPGLLSADNWVELLRSYQVIEHVVRERRLYVELKNRGDSLATVGFDVGDRFLGGPYVLRTSGGRYALSDKRGGKYEDGAVGDSIGRKRGWLWAPTAASLPKNGELEFTLKNPREVANQVLANLTTRLPDDITFIRLNYTATDPNEAASTLNAISIRFQSLAADLKKQKLEELVAGLATQVAQAQERLGAAEGTLQGYRVTTITEPRETDAGAIAPGIQMTQPSVIGNNQQLKLALEAQRQDRKAFEAVIAQAQTSIPSVDAFMTVKAVRGSIDLQKVLGEISVADAELRGALHRYTAEHDVVKLIQSKLNDLRNDALPRYANAVLVQLRAEEARLEEQIGRSDRDLRQIPVRTTNESRLQRDFESARLIFQTLQGEYEKAKLAELNALPDLRLLDPAVPPTSPSRNTTIRLILMGLGAGLGVGLLVAILLDRVDRRFRYPEQVTHDLRLHVVGAVPRIRRGRSELLPPDEAAQVVEAFRSIRLNLAHSFEDGARIAITVTSPGPGDGKSLICSNLALSFAEAGYRTLLIDGDTRRGQLHKTFGVQRQPGLIDYLAGEAALETIVHPSSHANLSVIASGTRRHQAPELLGSARMLELHHQLSAQYQVVLIDSPPLGAGVDAFILGTMSGSMLLIMRSGSTDREMAEARLQTLDRLPVRILGAVLNDIQPKLGTYRYYTYVEGYATSTET